MSPVQVTKRNIRHSQAGFERFIRFFPVHFHVLLVVGDGDHGVSVACEVAPKHEKQHEERQLDNMRIEQRKILRFNSFISIFIFSCGCGCGFHLQHFGEKQNKTIVKYDLEATVQQSMCT